MQPNLLLKLIPEHEESSETSPERMLLIAIIERAIYDYLGSDREQRRIAITWLFHEKGCRDFGFRWCLEELGYDGMLSKLRKALLKLTQATFSPRIVVNYSTLRVKKFLKSRKRIKRFRGARCRTGKPLRMAA